MPTLVVGLVIALPLRGVFRAPGPPMEEGFMLVFPEQLLEGDIPNRDYLHLYGPGSIWTIAAFFKVFGVSLWTERVVGLLQLVGLIAAMPTSAPAGAGTSPPCPVRSPRSSSSRRSA